MQATVRVPVVIRGRVLEDCNVEFGGRHDDVRFVVPDIRPHLASLLLRNPSQMADLHALRFDDIVDYLARLGEQLDIHRNAHLQAAFALSCRTSGLSAPILRYFYESIPASFLPAVVRETADRLVGIDYLEGWVPQPSRVHSGEPTRIRAFGARCVHVIAGNVPMVAVGTVIRNAFTRSDAIIKTPSNDPLTAIAIARTMVDMAPDHPLTRHLSAVYWKGGDEVVEREIYDPRAIDKIVAWGGFAGIKHVSGYLQPGLDLITLDPKHSATLIGPEAFASDESLHHVAKRLALDIGAMNQEGCVNARVVYVVSGTDDAGLGRIERLGRLTFEALQALPEHLSTPHKAFDPALKDEIDGLRYASDEYVVFGGKRDEGAIIVSRTDAPVDFARSLACRVANLVPIDDVEVAVRSVNAYTQTIGIFPETLKIRLRDRLAYQGAQRLVSLGAAAIFEDAATPQDGIEPVRRMCKWIVEQTSDASMLEALATRT
ncbi:Long-chain acyl-protein thioester reductase [Pandoraea terrae]|uniref:Long-chain acyl-protein thioester reductase n=1 Tax=Pandoraea terrae TaxID=1537710 RepID=A0A5E4WK71_9BURK|nr:acyl-CoA reductase [Pandoraea terrae]VVE23395.1 Long-chain acyl-protein thioester reductase [Pandoraea terrae]